MYSRFPGKLVKLEERRGLRGHGSDKLIKGFISRKINACINIFCYFSLHQKKERQGQEQARENLHNGQSFTGERREATPDLHI